MPSAAEIWVEHMARLNMQLTVNIRPHKLEFVAENDFAAEISL